MSASYVRQSHSSDCDCNFHELTGRRLYVRTCRECGTELKATDGCWCLTHDEGRCTWCGLDGDCTVPASGPAEGDRVCIHCERGHQRVIFSCAPGSPAGGTPVEGPCNCEQRAELAMDGVL